MWKWFVLALYQFWKGISAGPALKYFTRFIGAGGWTVSSDHTADFFQNLHNSLSYVTWLTHMWRDSLICDVTHSYVTWLTHMWHDSLICDMTHRSNPAALNRLECVRHGSLTCDVTHSYVTWLTHMWHVSLICDMTHSYVTWLTHMWHDSLICDMTHMGHDDSLSVIFLEMSVRNSVYRIMAIFVTFEKWRAVGTYA